LNRRPPRPERGGPCLRPRADTVGQDRIALCREDEIPGNSLFLTDVAGPRYHHSRNLTARCDRLPNQRRQVSRDRYMGRAARVGAGLHDHGTNQFAQGLHDFGVLNAARQRVTEALDACAVARCRRGVQRNFFAFCSEQGEAGFRFVSASARRGDAVRGLRPGRLKLTRHYDGGAGAFQLGQLAASSHLQL